jgi:hypothetical protein
VSGACSADRRLPSEPTTVQCAAGRLGGGETALRRGIPGQVLYHTYLRGSASRSDRRLDSAIRRRPPAQHVLLPGHGRRQTRLRETAADIRRISTGISNVADGNAGRSQSGFFASLVCLLLSACGTGKRRPSSRSACAVEGLGRPLGYASFRSQEVVGEANTTVTGGYRLSRSSER